jgi:hypothetical protein
MANYTIIGGDKKEYGPVTGEEIRQWIAEGRLDAFSLARSENDTEWRPLSTFPELASAFPNRAAAPPTLTALPGRSADGGHEAALEAVKNPAICLILTGLLNIFLSLWGAAEAVFSPVDIDQQMAAVPQFNDPEVQKFLSDPQVHHFLHLLYSPAILLTNDLFTLAMSILVLVGALRMKALRSYEFSFIAALLALLPCVTSCCLIGLPFGIWAILVLRRPGIKGQFK